jgi:hypothetical protein
MDFRRGVTVSGGGFGGKISTTCNKRLTLWFLFILSKNCQKN